MIIKICGVPFKIEEVPVIDEELDGITQGKIIFSEAKILIKENLPEELKKAVIFHEVLHGMLMQLGYAEQSADETFVQGLSNAMYQMFDLKNYDIKRAMENNFNWTCSDDINIKPRKKSKK